MRRDDEDSRGIERFRDARAKYRIVREGEQYQKEESNMKTMRARLTFIEDILGTASGNPALHTEYIASKAPDAETRDAEIAAVGADLVTEKTMTVFPRNEAGQEILWPYQIKGFFKSAQGTLNKTVSTEGRKAFPYLASYKGIIDNMVFVKATQDRWDQKGTGIVIHWPEGVEETYDCERPLRAETAQGPRVALAHSEVCPAGSWVEIDILVRRDDLMKNVREWLNGGIYYGIGQWRNAGHGRLVWEELDEKGKVIGGNKS